MDTLTLDGSWSLEPLDRDIINTYCPSLSGKTLSVSVPFDIHSSLLSGGFIEDPYVGQNALRSRFITHCRWRLSGVFSFTKEEGRVSTLVMTGVDAHADVRINSKTAGRCTNSFTRYLFNVTNILEDGENSIEIIFNDLSQVLEKKHERYPKLKDAALIRKSYKHFGPFAVTPEGIYDEIRIVSDDCLIVKSWNCNPRLVDHNWIMKVSITADVFRHADVDFNITVAGRKEHTLTHVNPDRKFYSYTFTIPEEDVALWWPSGMGGQHLYPLEIGFASYSDKRMIAFRTIRIANDPDERGRAFRIMVNGEDVFIKGAIWKGLEALPSRVTQSACIKVLNSAVQAGLNALRVHASSSYESELFYDSCDRLGLLIWHDFMFEEALYPCDDDFLSDVESELEYQILRLKSHPSVMLWCGGIYPQDEIGGDIRKTINYDRLNHGVLERCVKKLHPDAVYVPHSGAETMDSILRTHNDVSYGLSYHKDSTRIEDLIRRGQAVPRFVTSISFPSLPSLSTIQGFCEKGEMNIATDSMRRHQSGREDFDIITSAILSHYRFPDSLEKMIYLSQLAQAEVIGGITDYYRSCGGTCAGLFINGLVSSYPAADESAIEYSQKWKMMMYQLRAVFAPVTTICLNREGKITIYAVNDSQKECDAKVSLKFSSFHGDKLKMQVFRKILPPGSITFITSTEYNFIKNPRDAFAYVKLSTPDIYREDLVLLEEPKRCHVLSPQLNVEVRKNGRSFTCEISCKYPAFYVYLDAGQMKGTFTENLFSIRPTAQKVVSFIPDEEISLDEFRSALKIYDLSWASS